MDNGEQLAADVAAFWNPEAARSWVIAEGTRAVYGTIFAERLLFKTACRVLAKKGITLADLARKAS